MHVMLLFHKWHLFYYAQKFLKCKSCCKWRALKSNFTNNFLINHFLKWLHTATLPSNVIHYIYACIYKCVCVCVALGLYGSAVSMMCCHNSGKCHTCSNPCHKLCSRELIQGQCRVSWCGHQLKIKGKGIQLWLVSVKYAKEPRSHF